MKLPGKGIVVNPTPSSLFVIGRIIISCDSSIARLVLSVSFVTAVGVFLLVIKPVNDEFGYDGTNGCADNLSYGVRCLL